VSSEAKFLTTEPGGAGDTSLLRPLPGGARDEVAPRCQRWPGMVGSVLLDATAFAISWSLFLGLLGAPSLLLSGHLHPRPFEEMTVLLVAWLLALASTGWYRSQGLGPAGGMARRSLAASFRLVALLALAAALWPGQLSFRPGIAPVVAGAVAIGYILRGAARQGGWAIPPVRRRRLLVVGSDPAAQELARHLERHPECGLAVARALTGEGSDVLAALAERPYDAVSVVDPGALGPHGLRRLRWDLERLGIEMMVVPDVADIAGPGLRVLPLGGIPAVQVTRPPQAGATRVAKEAADRLLAGAALLVSSPILLAALLLVKATSPGPALFRQTRIGLGGKPFTMYKLRTMVVEAERLLVDLAPSNESDGVLFKIRRDPRVTPVGRWLRRLSLDELPQLLNVLAGQMSLVGPRPPLPVEVARYPDDLHRRFLVKPGITGLWQVSGRASLSWDESMRLDLDYVDNWSLVFDALILAKTFSAVVSGRGAY
jgi:exopolysaccharide biosynthesis polyprenyl glycosylphosphotransferase